MEKGYFVVDTNIFLEVAFGQERKEECFLFLERVAQGDISIIVSILTAHSVAIILCQHGMQDIAEKFLENIQEWRSCRACATTLAEDRTIVRLTRETGLDFEDAMQYYIAHREGAAIVSFDKHFDKVVGLRRIEPRDIF